jgi:hypothetical protein
MGYFMRNKRNFFEYFKEFKNLIEKQTGGFIKIPQSDKGGEYTSRDFFKYCKENGIQQQYIVQHTPK